MDLYALSSFASVPLRNPYPNALIRSRRAPRGRRNRSPIMAVESRGPREAKSVTLVTFLGKGGSGKTTASIIAAEHYANQGLRTCLVLHSQDPTAEHLMGCKIGSSPTEYKNNLSVVRLETGKMLLEPLERMKKVDVRLNLTQGILEGIVGEELGVLPGMDSIFSALALEKLINFLSSGSNRSRPGFDVVVYDGKNTEVSLRLIGASERARWYLKYLRDVAEKTDLGRLTSPSVLKMAYESASSDAGPSEGITGTEIWNHVEEILERATGFFNDSSKFRCYIVMDPSTLTSVRCALRYWGCAIQAGTQISGAFGFAQHPCPSTPKVSEAFSPLPFALMPYIATDSSEDWDTTLNSLSEEAKGVLDGRRNFSCSSVRFDPIQKSVTLFMPSFDKSEIKLYQYRGGSELLIEAGDQRRIIRLPPKMQGKVAGAKFVDRNLIVTLR